ncbi:hypothetical protein BD324DRAFT_620189 [Kockovaella imperatae]|uniref:Chromo domain-containing protein n=1 Tax=Kockovaella imperatae TaxID=4999 RepID=A0A1Y1UJM8_9TREE|nr:hypothetical protein BD324DRAFT_620189 [Kockovaella imperatae]ORX38261.1 hypothetical protein BD324DRAFT_620189 [Kockovaella imperatae]
MARLKSQSRSAGPKEAMDVDGVENIVDAPEEEAKAATNGAAEGEEEQEEGDGDEEEEEEGEYEVESIVDHKMQNGKYIYLVSWKGYGPEHNTWEPEAHV